MGSIAECGRGNLYYHHNIEDTYQSLLSLINSMRQSTPIVDRTGSLYAGQSHTIPFQVDTKTHSFRAFVSWSYNQFLTHYNLDNVSIKLYSPSGIEMTDHTYIYEGSFITIDYPEAGLWNAEIQYNNSADTSYVTYSFGVEPASDLVISVSPFPLYHSMETALPVGMSLNDYCSPLEDASVALTITRGDFSKSIPLSYGFFEEGVYGAYLYIYPDVISHYNTALPNTLKGAYELEFHIDIPSLSAQRVVRRFITLGAPSYNPSMRELSKGWNWVGFPRLEDTDIGTTIPYATVSLNPYLSQVLSKEGQAQIINGSGSIRIYLTLPRIRDINC